MNTPTTTTPLTLPPGRMHHGLWVSEDPITDPALYLGCVAAFPRTGRWPVLIPHDPRFEASGQDWIDDRPWSAPTDDLIGACEPADILASWWRGPCCDGTCLEPVGAAFPGLARRSPLRSDPLAEAGNTGSRLVAGGRYRLGITEVDRPADVPAALGWQGMLRTTEHADLLSTVLRSWEDRFGAVLLAVGYDALHLSVAAPPKTRHRAELLAAEHRAFCLDQFSAQPGTLGDVGAGLVGARLWSFWWE
ncbi:DUF4253 domain-containing protein [Prauserella rugosa]|uniref:Uncharacterized protein DUF4253 n=1 Tax=Prauserella rugosa TaxID=43354 RepID=A0A660CIV6_9PSEU|nr:DUF4253 domain-containing protein [Prauserella rugosa]KMS90602.1 hypothetical protein ACZ91_14180 [Streptomyces regensis]TWH21021.1 uncharacterized protein DUF4253 [Prauserella rugosa]